MSYAVRSVALISVDLDHDALVDMGVMLGLMLANEIRVDSMGHICRNHQGFADGTEMVFLTFGSEGLTDALGGLFGDVAVCTLS